MQKLGISEKHGLQPIYVILLVGIALRIPFIFTTSYTHDELSALYRLPSSFLDLFSSQSLVDAHPPFIQVFLYLYTSIFGSAEWVVKLPFALAGVWSIYIVYRIGKNHYSESAGLLVASVLAVTQLYLYHSVIIRPYIPGVLFTLLFTEKWLLIIRSNSTTKKDKIWYLTYALLCILTHHLCTLHVLLTVLLGFIPTLRKGLLSYLKLHFILLVLCLPALYVINFQLQFKGIGSWLSAPESDFFIQFFAYLFHYNYLFIGGLFLLAILGIWFTIRNPIIVEQHALLLALVFVLSFVIAYCYSVYRAPIIQFSLLQFSLPFFLLWCFQLFKPIKNIYLLQMLVAFVLGLGLFSLFVSRHHHELLNDFHYKSFAEFYHPHQKTNNHLVISSDRKEFYKRYTSVEQFYFTYGETNPWLLVKEKIKMDNPDVVISDNNDFITFSVLKSYYPYIYDVKEGIGNNFFVMGKKPLARQHPWETGDVWLYQNNQSIVLDSAHEFYNLVDTSITDFYSKRELQISFESQMLSTDENPCILVLELYEGKERKFWYGAELYKRADTTNFTYCYTTFDLTQEIKKLDASKTRVKAYLWNSQKKKTRVKEIKVNFREPNRKFFGLVEDIYW